MFLASYIFLCLIMYLKVLYGLVKVCKFFVILGRTDRPTNRQTHIQTDTQTDRLTERQTDTQTDRETDRPIDLGIKKLLASV